jgi:hypothetical protein
MMTEADAAKTPSEARGGRFDGVVVVVDMKGVS